MFLSGVQSEFHLDSRLKHAGVTDFGRNARNRPAAIESLGKLERPNTPMLTIHGKETARASMKKLTRVEFVALATLLHAPLDAQEKKQPADFLTVWPGMVPIILAAPHGGREAIPGVAARRGIGVPQFTTERDNNTAELAELVAGKISERLAAKPFLVIARFERKYVDVNRADATAYESAGAKPHYDAYHRALEAASHRVRQNWSAGVLLDIHGQGAAADTIFRGTNNGKSVSALEQKFGREAIVGPKSISGQLAAKGYKIEPGAAADGREHRYTGGYTTRTYGSHRGSRIDAIQLEFGTNLRSRRNLERTANDLAEAIESFAKAYLPLAISRPREPAVTQP
jgi:N-formylglutamate amidohydrolase